MLYLGLDLHILDVLTAHPQRLGLWTSTIGGLRCLGMAAVAGGYGVWGGGCINRPRPGLIMRTATNKGGAMGIRDVPAASLLAGRAMSAARRASALEDVELLERQREQAALGELIAAACGGVSGLVAVEGAAGIGKTVLLGIARAEAEQAGMGVLAARGSPLEREFAYGIVRQLFEPVLAATSPAERDELFGGAAGQAVTLLGQAGHTPISTDGGTGSLAILHGLFWLTANLCAQRPLALVIDDLHWTDIWSLRFLAYLLPRLDGLPVLVVVALRPAEPAADQQLLAQIVTDPLARLLHPAPLSQAASAQLVRAVLIDEATEEFCAVCHAATGGNPLLLRELAAATVAEGVPSHGAGEGWLAQLAPRAIGRRVALRLAQLGPAAAALAHAVAVLGEGADPAQAAALARLESEETCGAACQLAAVEILRPLRSAAKATSNSHRALGFVHPLVRAAVYEGLSEPERIQKHACAARLLTEAGAAPEQIAAHLFIVPPRSNPETVATLRQAAEQALVRGAPDSAVVYLERCLAEPPSPEERVEVLIRLGAIAQLVDMTKAAEHLSAALTLIQQPQRRALLAEMLGNALFFVGRNDEAIAVYTQALAEAREHVDLRRRLQASLINIALYDPSLLPPAAEWTDRLHDEPLDDGLGSRMLDCMVAMHDACAGVSTEAAVARARRGLAGGDIGEQASGFTAFVQGCIVLVLADLDEVMPLWDAALTQAHQRGSILDLAGAKCFRALAWLRRGFPTEAEADARDAMRATQTARLDVIRPYAAVYMADALIEQGRLAEAESALNWANAPNWRPPMGHCLWLLGHARLLLCQGQTEQALEAMLAVGRRLVAYDWQNPAIDPWRSTAALALLSLSRHDQAHALAAEELELARRWGAPRTLGISLRVAGLVEGGQRGLALLRQAVDVLAPSPARLEHAKALIELGAALRRTGRRTESRQHLRQGIDQAKLCGATPLVQRGLTELRATGARPRRTRLSGPAALTPSEHRVAELAATGRSNREIAQTLFITTHTVEVHLTRAYRKLGITSRRHLTRILSVPHNS
jgi:DNA-binding CsgD family transcriptional regulator/predicted negative regulator of RcsB-dependent stress response